MVYTQLLQSIKTQHHEAKKALESTNVELFTLCLQVLWLVSQEGGKAGEELLIKPSSTPASTKATSLLCK